MSETPTVAAVIPVFNRPDELESAIRSVLAQTRPVAEIIAVDDGSTPPIDPARFAAMDPRVRVISYGGNRGGGAARNAGIDAARSDWIAFLDSDDLWLPHKLEAQFAAIGALADPSRTVCASNFILRVPGEAERPFNKRPPGPGELSRWIFVEDNTVQTSTIVLPTALARGVRFDDRLRRHQDWDFVLRLDQAGATLLYLDTCLSIYDSSPKQDRVSRRNDVAGLLTWLKLAECRIEPRDILAYYIGHIFHQHRDQSLPAAVAQLARMTFSSPGGWRVTTGHFLRRIQVRLGRGRPSI